MQSALLRALDRTIGKLPAGGQTEDTSPPYRSHLLVSAKGGDHLVPLEEIIYFKADNKYVVTRTAEENHLITEALATMEGDLAGVFVRIHRNALVATRHIAGLKKAENGSWSVYFDAIDEKLKVSRRHKPGLRRWLRQQS
ncbi:MAG: LytTR family DNA-binding domain-containing protein [Pseudomonadota bacterium]|nr:LytTR family DNA-binding domain-containing protein [Pseudomonadota bacterium]